MTKIAYFTDLHPMPNSPRIAGLVSATRKLEDIGVRHLFIGGDFISFPGSFNINSQCVWDVLKTRPVTRDEYRLMFEYAKDLAEEVIPQFIDADPDLDRIAICGNTDYVGYRYMSSVFAAHFTFLEDLSVKRRFAESESESIIRGTIGIPGGKADRLATNAYNPWYRGISVPNLKPGPRPYIFMSHMPAFPQPDGYHGSNLGYKEDHEGNRFILDLIGCQSPVVHLTGHVHDGPEADGNIFKVWPGRSGNVVSINPGGGNLHDPFIRMAIIDLEKLNAIPNDDLFNSELLAQAIQLLPLE